MLVFTLFWKDLKNYPKSFGSCHILIWSSFMSTTVAGGSPVGFIFSVSPQMTCHSLYEHHTNAAVNLCYLSPSYTWGSWWGYLLKRTHHKAEQSTPRLVLSAWLRISSERRAYNHQIWAPESYTYITMINTYASCFRLSLRSGKWEDWLNTGFGQDTKSAGRRITLKIQSIMS